MNKKRILVISADAMVCEDLERLSRMPNYKKYLEGGCRAEKGMRSIYPSVTYPAHISMITGCYPDMHGVSSNFQFTTADKDQNWLWFSDAYRSEDIFAAAKKAGYRTAAISWPGTAGNPNIDWLMAEYWMPKQGDTLRSSFRDAGSGEAMLDLIEANAKYLPAGYEKGGKKNFMQWPDVDEFIMHVACDVIAEHAPELVFVHIGAFDAYRHANGVFGPWIDQAVSDLDRYIGWLMDACKEAGVAEETNLVLVSDHGQRAVSRIFSPNVLFARQGWITVGQNNTITDWQVFSFSNAMSALIYLKNPEDRRWARKVYEYLKTLKLAGGYGIGKVFTREEVKEKEHLWGDFSFVIESDGETSFDDNAIQPLWRSFGDGDYRTARATHGYLPDEGPQPVFAAKGPDWKKKTVFKRGNLVDEAPTYARLLGVELPSAQGRVMTELLEYGSLTNGDDYGKI